MTVRFAGAALAALLASAPALAAPVISGKYIVTITKVCQMVDTYNFASGQGIGNYLNEINTGGSSYRQSMLLATFSPTKGTVSVNGFDDGGDIEIFQFTGSITGTEGSQIAQAPDAGSKIPYAVTDTTLTIGGQAFNALYGQVNKNGIAGYIAFQGVFAGTGTMCTEQAVAQAQ